MSVSDPYKVLQVDPEAEDEVIEAAYRRLARKYHPDVSPDSESHERMIAINQAWEVLKDPARRAAHDRTRARSKGAAAWVAAADAQARTAGNPPATSGGHGQAGPQARQSASQPAAGPGSSGSAGARPFGSMSDPSVGFAAAGTGAGPSATARVPLGGFSSGAASRRDGEGAAGPPPGNPSGSVLNFGRYAGWSLGEIARTEVEYLEWLDRMPIGRTYQQEIDEILRGRGLRPGPANANQGRGGPFRRR